MSEPNVLRVGGLPYTHRDLEQTFAVAPEDGQITLSYEQVRALLAEFSRVAREGGVR